MITAKEVAAKIESLSPADQLRLAGDLIDEKMFDLAHTIVQRIADELLVVSVVKKHVDGPTGRQENG